MEGHYLLERSTRRCHHQTTMILRETQILHLLMQRDLAYSVIASKVIGELVTSKMTSRSLTSLLTASTQSNISQAYSRPRGDSQDTAWARPSNSRYGRKKRSSLW
jgi:hypothetical protein